jgi:hypothetical protein
MIHDQIPANNNQSSTIIPFINPVVLSTIPHEKEVVDLARRKLHALIEEIQVIKIIIN